jgi:hypothetical protein
MPLASTTATPRSSVRTASRAPGGKRAQLLPHLSPSVDPAQLTGHKSEDVALAVGEVLLATYDAVAAEVAALSSNKAANLVHESERVGLGNPVMALTSVLVRTLDARHAAWWYSLIAPFRIRRRSIGPVAAGMVGRVAFGGRCPRVRCGRWPL